MLPNVLVPTMLWLGQAWPGITFLAPTPPGPQPEYAQPVIQEGPFELADDPAILCIHRDAALPYSQAEVDRAAMRLMQLARWSRLREAEAIEGLGPPSETARRTVPSRPPSVQERLQRRALAGEIDRHWQLFEARVYEVRMYEHRGEAAQRACKRSAEAWDALLGLIQQYPGTLPADLQDEMESVDALVGVLRAAAVAS